MIWLTPLGLHLKQNWEVNHILVNLASYFIALWKLHPFPQHPCPGFHYEQWCSIGHRKDWESGVNCSFSSPLCQRCIPLVQFRHHCAPHHSTAQYGVTDFFLGRSHCSGQIQIPGCTYSINTLTTFRRDDPPEQGIISIASQIRDLNQIMSHFKFQTNAWVHFKANTRIHLCLWVRQTMVKQRTRYDTCIIGICYSTPNFSHLHTRLFEGVCQRVTVSKELSFEAVPVYILLTFGKLCFLIPG